jgi:predicted DNA-binding ribbon-helix-helix protein
LQNPSKDFVHSRPLRYGLGMTARPIKRSLTLNGHRTSVSLEDAFWVAFREIAAMRGQPINELAAEIDTARSGDEGLASAIRVFVLDHYRATRSNVTARSP